MHTEGVRQPACVAGCLQNTLATAQLQLELKMPTTAAMILMSRTVVPTAHALYSQPSFLHCINHPTLYSSIVFSLPHQTCLRVYCYQQSAACQRLASCTRCTWDPRHPWATVGSWMEASGHLSGWERWTGEQEQLAVSVADLLPQDTQLCMLRAVLTWCAPCRVHGQVTAGW